MPILLQLFNSLLAACQSAFMSRVSTRPRTAGREATLLGPAGIAPHRLHSPAHCVVDRGAQRRRRFAPTLLMTSTFHTQPDSCLVWRSLLVTRCKGDPVTPALPFGQRQINVMSSSECATAMANGNGKNVVVSPKKRDEYKLGGNSLRHSVCWLWGAVQRC